MANTQLFTNLNSIYADDESAYTDTVEVDELEEEAYEPVNDDDIDFGDLPDVTPAHSDISAAMEDGGISSVILEEQSKTDTIQSSVTPTFEISVEQSSDMPEPATIRLETEKTQRDEQIYLVEEPVIEGRQTEVLRFSFALILLSYVRNHPRNLKHSSSIVHLVSTPLTHCVLWNLPK